jgi:hypothetical protein
MLKRLWQTSAPLTGTGLFMLAALAATLVALVVDARTITGAPAWLKPAKFAVSIAIYTFTLAWVFTFIPGWVKTRRIVGSTTAIALVLELIIIDVQAWRGTTSHFNVGTPLDAVLFTVMGLMIIVQTLATIAVAVALWRERFANETLGWALRLGMTMTIVGALSGGVMTQPTEAQLEAARSGSRMTIAGAHTVGAPDGGPGLPGTGWSTTHGDIRVAHFLGLHAMQVLPILALVLGRRRMIDRTRVRLMLIASASYASLFAILLWQALRGQSLLAPDGLMLQVLAVWVGLTILAGAIAALRSRHPGTWAPDYLST